MGWIVVMFDLPVLTSEQRKEATEFRKELLEDGYFMLQYSVYARACISTDRLKKHKRRLKYIVPHAGNVRVFFITDHQWEKSMTIVGPDYNLGNRAVSLQMPQQMEFWE